MIRLLLFTPLIIGLIVGLLFLQVKLSNSANKWLGLIPSLTFFLLSIIVIFGLAAFTTQVTTQVTTSTMNGEVVESYTDDVADGFVVSSTDQTRLQLFLHLITILITFDWPIIILLSMHFVIRSKRSRRNEFNRMNIQDL